MIEINGRQLCESCFSEISEKPCPFCGYGGEISDDTAALPAGTLLNKNIIVGKTMGKGGFGITYLCYDTKKDKKIAVKEYFPNGTVYRSRNGGIVSAIDESCEELFKKGAENFYREAKTISGFRKDGGIVSVYDLFHENGTVYIAMEYLDGITLKKYIKEHGVISENQAVFLFDKLAATLDIIHSGKILHRDISSDNIMICNNGEIKLIDFGAARRFDSDAPSNYTVILKPGYTPIEQYTKKGKQGEWTDIYSLGVSVYYALTESVIADPYERLDNDENFEKNRFGITKCLWELIRKCTMITPSERYKNASELKKAVSEAAKQITPQPIITDSVGDDLKGGPADIPKKNTAPVRAFNVKKLLTAAALAVLSAAVIVGTSYFTDKKLTDPPVGISFELDSEYPGMYISGTPIVKETLLDNFTGDIKVTLELEPFRNNPWEGVSEEPVYAYGIRIRDMMGRPVDVSAFNSAVNNDGFFAFFDGLEEFVFVLPRSSLEKAEGGICFATDNVIVKSASAEEYDPSMYKAGRNALSYDMSEDKDSGYTKFISKSDLESMGGDVLITAVIKKIYYTDYPKYKPVDQNDRFIPISGDNIIPAWFGDFYLLGNGENVEQIRFIISEDEISGLGDEGLRFMLSGLQFGKVYIEPA